MSKIYAHQKTWNEDGRRIAVRADTLEDMWRKYYERRYGLEGIEEEIPEALLSKLLRDTSLNKRRMTVSQWVGEVGERKQTEVSESYFYQFSVLMRKYLTREIGGMYLTDVKPDDCKRIMDGLKYQSQSLIKKVYNYIRLVFRTAYEEGLIDENPTKGLRKPKAKMKHERRALTDDETKALKVAWDKYPDDLFVFKVMYYTGCRPTEIWRMKKGDIFEKDGKRMIKIEGSKSKSANRNIPFPDELWNDIKGLKRGEYLVRSREGNAMNRNLYNRKAKRLRREMDIVLGAETYRNEIIESKLGDFVPYDIRHDYCCRLARNSVDVRVAQRLLGHSSIIITVNIYSHISDDDILNNYSGIIEGVTGVLP